jgi:hypothetical protein
MIVGGGDWKLESRVRHLINLILVAKSDGRGERPFDKFNPQKRGREEWMDGQFRELWINGLWHRSCRCCAADISCLRV